MLPANPILGQQATVDGYPYQFTVAGWVIKLITSQTSGVATHTHDAADVVSGVFNNARLPTINGGTP